MDENRILNLDGYTDVPAGKIAAIVTYLEMRERPALREAPRSDRSMERIGSDLARYKALFRRVGEPWLWFSRLTIPDAQLAAILSHPEVDAYALREETSDVGLLELDFRVAGECRLVFFGVAPEAIGTGAGRQLMNAAIALAFARGVARFSVHTCSLDHPAALPFYLRSGFVAYKRAVEVADDPRLAGRLPPEAAPRIPLIAGPPVPRRRPRTRSSRPGSDRGA